MRSKKSTGHIRISLDKGLKPKNRPKKKRGSGVQEIIPVFQGIITFVSRKIKRGSTVRTSGR